MKNSNRIAKNAFSLYIRMAIATIVSLYTSRVVLQQLGADGYGTFTLVAGIVTFWLFLNGSMTTASTRFLSVAIEKGDSQEIKRTYSSVVFVHFIIAILLIILGESIGLWFFLNKLKILPEYASAARMVYQLSILSVIIGIMQVPFTAMCVAEERMGIFAVFEILNSGIKLGSAFLLIYVREDKLIIYSILLLVNAMLLFIGYFVYVRCILGRRMSLSSLDKHQIKQIFSFTSWDLYANGAVSVRMQGTAVLYNIFISTIANAALGISLQIHGVLTSFANNIATAVRPQITKTYASQAYAQMQELVISGAKLMSGLILIPIIPIFIFMPYILDIWLGAVPEYTLWFARLTLIAVYYWTCSTLLHSVIHASGYVKKYSFISGTIILSEVAIMYALFHVVEFAYIPQLLRIIVLIILGIIMLRTIKSYIPEFNSRKFLIEVYVKGTLTMILAGVSTYIFSIYLSTGSEVLDLLLLTLIGLVFVSTFLWFYNFSVSERIFTMRLMRSVLIKCRILKHE